MGDGANFSRRRVGGWSLYVGEWFTLKCFMGGGVVFRGEGAPLTRAVVVLDTRQRHHLVWSSILNE